MKMNVLAIILQAEENTGFSKRTLYDLLILCHRGGELKETIEEEVADVFGDAVKQINTAEYKEEIIRTALVKAKEFDLFDFTDLLCLIQDEEVEQSIKTFLQKRTRFSKMI